jgi:hypothetical protein
MIEIKPEQGAFLLQLELPAVKNEHRTTRRVIEAIPSDRGDYRPDPQSKTALELAWHIVAAEERFYGGVAGGAFDFTPIHKPEGISNSAGIAAWYGDSFEKNFEKLTKLSGEPKCWISEAPFRCRRSTSWSSPCATRSTTEGSYLRICGQWAERCRRSTVRAMTLPKQRKQHRRVKSTAIAADLQIENGSGREPSGPILLCE